MKNQKPIKIIAIVALFSFLNCNAFALDTSIDYGKQKKTDKEVAQSLKRTRDEKKSYGHRDMKTKGEGGDDIIQNSVRESGHLTASSSAEIIMPLDVIFRDIIAAIEKDIPPFKECRVISNPLLPKDFGITSEIKANVIDNIKADYITKAAQSNSFIKAIADEQALIVYRSCLAYYGSVIAQSYLNLNNSITEVKGMVSKDKDGNIVVDGIGYDDFIVIAEGALIETYRNGIKNQTLLSLINRALNEQSPCRFDKQVENINCGSVSINISASPSLSVSGIELYGKSFAGYHASYKVSRSFSYSNALEKLKSSSKYYKWVAEVSTFAENLESEGKAKEATIVRKKAWEIAKSGKQTVSPSKLLPVQ